MAVEAFVWEINPNSLACFVNLLALDSSTPHWRVVRIRVSRTQWGRRFPYGCFKGPTTGQWRRCATHNHPSDKEKDSHNHEHWVIQMSCCRQIPVFHPWNFSQKGLLEQRRFCIPNQLQVIADCSENDPAVEWWRYPSGMVKNDMPLGGSWQNLFSKTSCYQAYSGLRRGTPCSFPSLLLQAIASRILQLTWTPGTFITGTSPFLSLSFQLWGSMVDTYQQACHQYPVSRVFFALPF